MELISVIVPIYKVEQYLDQCIKSIVNQTYRSIEIILVDDGSPDRCPEICDSWAVKDPRIRVIHMENGGVSRARNAGMDISSGSYVCFIDSDDFIEPEFVEYLYRAICETGSDISKCDYHRFSDPSEPYYDNKGMSSPVIRTGEEALHNFTQILKPNYMVWNKLYRRELAENEPFLDGRQAQDVLFSCRIFGKCKSIACIENVLYHWRIREGSATFGFIRQRLDAIETFWLSIKYLEENYPQFLKDLKNNYISLCYGAYEWVLEFTPKEDQAEPLNRVNEYRRRIKYTREEWSDISLRNKIRYICSDPAIIKFSMKIRILIDRLCRFKKRK